MPKRPPSNQKKMKDPYQNGVTTATESVSDVTRVCIKNVPLSYTEAKLMDHLTSKSSSPKLAVSLVITDCKILKTKSGKSRKLAFVGFKNADMASLCVSHFHKSYAGTSRLIVEPAFSKTEQYDASVHRPWSKHSVGSSKYIAAFKRKEDKVADKNETLEKRNKQKNNVSPQQHLKKKTEKADLKKEEFLAAMGAGGKGKFWSNDDGITDVRSTPKNDVTSLNTLSDDDDNDDSSTCSTSSINDEEDSPKTSTSKAPDALVDDDMEFLQSKVTHRENLLSDQESDDDDDSGNESSSVPSSSSDDESDDEEEETKGANEKLKANLTDASASQNITTTSTNNNDVFSSTRLFVRNLPFQTTEEELKEYFEKYGSVTECHIPIDDRKKRKGYAFIRYASENSASTAKEALDRSDFQGRLIHVLAAKKAPHEIELEKSQAGAEGDKLLFKQQKEKERQRMASSNTKGWNASILRTDAVVDNLSSRLDIDKSDILTDNNGNNTSAAVRLAIGETHILEENRSFFANHGIDLAGLVSHNGPKAGDAKRSSNQILIKNLPFNSNQEELLYKLFTSHQVQSPTRLLLPPSKTVVLIEYEHPTEARSAFRKLAYKRFQHVPLYLEWALLSSSIIPENVPNEGDEIGEGTADSVKFVSKLNTSREEEEEQSLDKSDYNQTIFVKNLNFTTTEKELKDYFTEKGGIEVRAVRIPKKEITSQLRLSLGYGFVECESSKDAQAVLKNLNDTFLDGHSLQLFVSSKRIASTDELVSGKRKHKKKLPTNIAVKNIPFQASKSEITALFGNYGKLKKFRLPKKFGSAQHRGFGFVEFVSGEEAQKAMESLSRTHLYGRKLVLEWAQVSGDDDKNTSSTFDYGAQAPKKIRFQN